MGVQVAAIAGPSLMKALVTGSFFCLNSWNAVAGWLLKLLAFTLTLKLILNAPVVALVSERGDAPVEVPGWKISVLKARTSEQSAVLQPSALRLLPLTESV